MKHTISREQIKAMLDSGEPITLVEALPRRYFDKHHLPGAINLPHDEVSSRAADLLPDKDALIVVYCASTECRNSAIARDALERLGYGNALEYVEGKQDWLEAGYPLESARRVA
jgi:rhodanese-related sulfurtransferase